MMWDLIVWSDDTIDFVPSKWSNENGTKYKCPEGLSDGQKRKIIYDCEDLTDNFTWCDARLKERDIKDLHRAKELCKAGQYTSTVENTKEDEETGKRRKRKTVRLIEEDTNPPNPPIGNPRRKLRFISSDDSSEDEGSAAVTKIFDVPVDEDPGDRTLFSANGQETTVGETVVGSSGGRTGQPNKAPFSGNKRHGTTNSVHETVGGSNNRDSTIKTAVYVERQRPGRFIEESDVESLNGDRTSQIDGRSNASSVPLSDTQYEGLRFEIMEVKRKLSHIENLLMAKYSTDVSIASNDGYFINTLPVTTNEDLEQLDDLVRSDDAKCLTLIKMLALLGGDTVHKTVYLVMDKIIGKQLALEYSGQGKKKKKSFSTTKLYNVVIGATRQRHATATDAEIIKSIGLFLASAKGRLPKMQ